MAKTEKGPWIEWTDGVDCPVDPEAKVWLKTSASPDGSGPFLAGDVKWDNSARSNQLRAYRAEDLARG